jgi:hypothetical protein
LNKWFTLIALLIMVPFLHAAPGLKRVKIYGTFSTNHVRRLTGYHSVIMDTPKGEVYIYFNKANQLVIVADNYVKASQPDVGNMLFIDFSEEPFE